MWRTPKQEPSSRGARASRTNALAAETYDMESRLEDLRRAMDKERAKRDRLINRMASGGAIWGNSQSNPSTTGQRSLTRKETPSSTKTAAQFQAFKTKGSMSRSHQLGTKNPEDDVIKDNSDTSSLRSRNPNTPDQLPGKTNRSFGKHSTVKKTKAEGVSGVGDAQAFIASSKDQRCISTGHDASTAPIKNSNKTSCSTCTSTEPPPETNKMQDVTVIETQTEPGPSSTRCLDKIQEGNPDRLYFSRLFMKECSTQASKQAAEKTECSKPEAAVDQPAPEILRDTLTTHEAIPLDSTANTTYDGIRSTYHVHPLPGHGSTDGSTTSDSTDDDSLDHEVKIESVQLCLTSGIRLPDKIVLPQSD